MPIEVAEASRYENIKGELYGIEGKDFFLPREWADKRQPMDPPPLPAKKHESKTITEITSNVAKPGIVLDYDKETRQITVVEKICGDEAMLLTKGRGWSRDQYIRKLVPIRRVVPLWNKK